jgi:hypothetical protein
VCNTHTLAVYLCVLYFQAAARFGCFTSSTRYTHTHTHTHRNERSCRQPYQVIATKSPTVPHHAILQTILQACLAQSGLCVWVCVCQAYVNGQVRKCDAWMDDGDAASQQTCTEKFADDTSDCDIDGKSKCLDRVNWL